MVLDTGSDVTWIQCLPCIYCYPQADPIFKPHSSASYSPLSCQSRQCKALLDRYPSDDCRNYTCLYEVSYGDGSCIVGNFVTETITIGLTSVKNIALGCGHNNEGLFLGAAGLLGLGGGSLSLPAQLNASSFSYCLVDHDSNSKSTLEFNSPLPLNAVTAPLRRNYGLDTFYYVELIGLSFGGELLPIPESSFELDGDGMGGTIVDSGTMVTWLRREEYDMLRGAFVKYTYGLQSAKGVGLFDACYDLSFMDSVEVPTVSFHFPEGKSWCYRLLTILYRLTRRRERFASRSRHPRHRRQPLVTFSSSRHVSVFIYQTISLASLLIVANLVMIQYSI